MRPVFCILILAALVVARPLDAATDAVGGTDHLDALIEKAWQNDVAGQDFKDLPDRPRRRLKKFIKGLVKSEVKKALEGMKPSGGTDGKPGKPAEGGKPTDGTDGGTGKPGTDGNTGKPGTDGNTGKPGTDGSAGKPGTGGSTDKPGSDGNTGTGTGEGSSGTTPGSGGESAPACSASKT